MASETHINKGSKKTQRISYPPTQRLYDLKTAAIYLGRSVYSVRELIWKGKIPYIKDGKKQYLDVFDMNAYIEKNKEVMV